MTMWASILCAVAFAAIIVDNKWPTHLSKHDTDRETYIEDYHLTRRTGREGLVSHFQVASRLSSPPRRSRSGTRPQSEQRHLISVRSRFFFPPWFSGKTIFSESHSGQRSIILGMKVVSSGSSRN